MFPSFTGLHRPVKGTKVSTVLSTPGDAGGHGGSYLDIGMGGHFEGFGFRIRVSKPHAFIKNYHHDLKVEISVVFFVRKFTSYVPH